MAQYGHARHFCSWAGICPGNNESGGKRHSGRTNDGDKWLKGVLTEAAWAAVRTKKSYFSAQYRRLAARRGKKRALVAVGHSILTIVFHLINNKASNIELGDTSFDKLNTERLKRHLTKRLESLGYQVGLTKRETAA